AGSKNRALRPITRPAHPREMTIPLLHGQPVRFGKDNEKGVVITGTGAVRIVDVAEVGESAILVHDEKRAEPGLAFMLAQLAQTTQQPTPIGVFRAVEAPEYAGEASRQLAVSQERSGPGDLSALLHSLPTWEV